MSKSSTTFGVIIAVIIHALLFLPAVSAERKAEPKASQVKPVKIQASLAKPAEKAKPAPVKPHTKPNFKKLASARPAETSQPGQTSAAAKDDIHTPRLRMTCGSKQHLREVVEAMGMRIVAVNSGGQVVGQIAGDNKPALVEFDAELSQFSNRVRTLPRNFFGRQLDGRGREVSGLWILVPASVDQWLIKTQLEAAGRRGVGFGQVRVMDGVFEAQGGQYKIVITNVVLS